LNEIKTRTYIHILTSSKLALFNISFKKILQTFDFCDRVYFVVIDETHLMKNWFSWRIKYDRFCELRSILFRIISFFVTSIIFEDELIAKLIKKLKFSENVKFIHESMNRKKIFFNVQNIHVAFIVNFENLRFLIANVNQSLKKIILYEERIQTFIYSSKWCELSWVLRKIIQLTTDWVYLSFYELSCELMWIFYWCQFEFSTKSVSFALLILYVCSCISLFFTSSFYFYHFVLSHLNHHQVDSSSSSRSHQIVLIKSTHHHQVVFIKSTHHHQDVFIKSSSSSRLDENDLMRTTW
jgi:hypothetical protein